MEKATLKQVEFIMALTRRPYVGSLPEKDFNEKLGKSIWDLDKKEREVQFRWLSISSVIVAVGSLVAFMIPAAKLPLSMPKSNPIITIGQGWSLTGSLLAEAVLMLVMVLEWLKRLLTKLKEREEFNRYLMEAVGVVFFGLILFLDIYPVVLLSLLL